MKPQSPSEQDISYAAHKLPPTQRAAYLAKACSGDDALRARVEALLAVQSSADALFDPASQETHAGGSGTGAGGTVRLTSPTERPGDIIGPYKLREQIGEGGCGVVYVAEQEKPIRRKVALKVIKLGMDTKSVIARFEAERQALAMMDHPNIARVLDAGTTNAGRPYFVMELVRGIKITDYCDQANLSTKDRLDLFIKVCSAIQHAHQKGIIHRDIKPSNILVTLHDGVPVPKVIDFGIAKATEGRLTDATVYTELHAFIGTPAYMSPEQAEMSGLDIDTRADIYSLGVLLYELLTGKPPFDAKDLMSQGFDAMRRTIREVEPARPSTRLGTLVDNDLTTLAKRRSVAASQLQHQLKGDLDWIVMKALEKDRTRRYETANGFAADITRHLTNEPVLARPPTAAYRFQKAYRRNRLAFAAGGAIAAAMLVGITSSVWQAVRAMRAEKQTADTLKQVAAARDAKEQARQEAEAISKFLGEVFQSPDPTRDGREIRVAELLDRAAKKLETDLATQPAQQAKLQAALARTYSALGLARQASPLGEQVRDYLLATFGPEHHDTLTAMSKLAGFYYDAGRRAEALKLREDVLPLRRKLSGSEHPDTLIAMRDLAASYHEIGRRDEAVKLKEQVLLLSRKVNGPEHPDTLEAMHNLAASYFDAGRRDDTLKLREHLLALRRKLSGPEHPDTLVAMHDLATSYNGAGRKEEALKMREEVLKFRRKVLGSEHPDSPRAMQNLAISYFQVGRRDEALKLQEEALSIRRKVNGPEHPDTIKAIGSLATSYRAAGRLDEALRLREEVLPLSRTVNGPEHPETLIAMHDLATSYHDVGRRDEALSLREVVVTLRRKVLGPEHPNTLGAMIHLARSYRSKGQVIKAEDLEKEIAAVKAKATPAGKPEAR